MIYKDSCEKDIKRAIKYAKTSMEIEGFIITKKDEEKVKVKLLDYKRKNKNER